MRATCQTTTLVVMLLASTLLSGGCSPDFDPYSRLTSLRVLAVQSDPPNPGPGETTRIVPLLYAPEGETISYQWTWCPLPGSAGDGYPCLVTEQQLAMLGVAGLPSFDLGTAPEAFLAHSIPAAALEQICAPPARGDGGAPSGVPFELNCEGGFPVQVKLTITTSRDRIVTVKQLRLRFSPKHEPNTNPRLDGLTFVPDPKVAVEVPIGTEPTVVLTRDEENVVRAVFPPSNVERYTEIDDAGKEVPNTAERLFVSWFVESGDVSDERTGFIEGSTTIDQAREIEWTLGKLKDYKPGVSIIVAVVRDNRGGVGWAHGKVALKEKEVKP